MGNGKDDNDRLNPAQPRKAPFNLDSHCNGAGPGTP